MRFHVITIFPDIFDSYLNESIIGRAIKEKHISVGFYNPRDFIKDIKGNGYKPVDDKPYTLAQPSAPIIDVAQEIPEQEFHAPPIDDQQQEPTIQDVEFSETKNSDDNSDNDRGSGNDVIMM